MQKFNTDRSFLSQRIFDTVRPKDGIKTVLNITVLPDYLAYLKCQLSSDQRLVLSEYNLQNLLMEYAVHGNKVLNQNEEDKSVCKNMEDLTNKILQFMRGKRQFWLKKTNNTDEKQKQHHAIEAYNKHIEAISKIPLKTESLKSYKTYRYSFNKKIYNQYSFWNYPSTQNINDNNPKIIVTLYPFILQFITCYQQIQKKKQQEEQQLRKIQKIQQIGQQIIQQNQKQKQQQKQQQKQKQKIEQCNQLKPQFHKTLQQCLIYFTFWPRSGGQKYFDQEVKSPKLIFFFKWLQRQKSIIKNIVNGQQCIFFANILEIVWNVKQILTNKSGYTKQNQNIEQIKYLGVKILNKQQINKLSFCFIKKYDQQIKEHLEQANKEENNSKIKIAQQNNSENIFYKFSPNDTQIPAFQKQYEDLMNHPTNISLQNYKITGSQIPWQDNYYQIFLSCLKEVFLFPTNNRKIAIEMSKRIHKNIEPNHVKHIKGIYLRNMSKRIQNGECGGGKRGRVISKQDFLAKDIQSFNMRYFRQVSKQNRKKKTKKRRQTSSEQSSPQVEDPSAQ